MRGSTLAARAMLVFHILLTVFLSVGVVGIAAVPAAAVGASIKVAPLAEIEEPPPLDSVVKAEPQEGPPVVYTTQSTSSDTCSNGTKKTKVKSKMTVVSTANSDDGTVFISSAKLSLAKTHLGKFVKGQVAFTYIKADGSSGQYFEYDDTNPSNPLTFSPNITAHNPKGVSIVGGVYFKLKGGKKVWSCTLNASSDSV